MSRFCRCRPSFSILSGRVTRIRTFDEEDNPSAPAVALQLAARDIAEDWNHLLAAVSDIPRCAWMGGSDHDRVHEESQSQAEERPLCR
jgi:hypothetical protein